MSEYLKREDVRRAVLHKEGDALIAAIDELPTVEVIRCKECTFHNEINCPQYYRRNELPDDWFCADGKAAENE